MARIYKILPRAEWRAAQVAGAFAGSAVDLADGYIHMSTEAQLAETARRHFAGRGDLLLLTVDLGRFGDHDRPRRGAHHMHAIDPVAAVRLLQELV